MKQCFRLETYNNLSMIANSRTRIFSISYKTYDKNISVKIPPMGPGPEREFKSIYGNTRVKEVMGS